MKYIHKMKNVKYSINSDTASCLSDSVYLSDTRHKIFVSYGIEYIYFIFLILHLVDNEVRTAIMKKDTSI
jgi:hypothetical protein